MKRIFVTSGTQLPFPRMLQVVDKALDAFKDVSVIVQSRSENDVYANFSVESFLSPAQYSSVIKSSDLIISHAGMGGIITAFEENKSIALMPRKFELGEHRNDHQLSTILKFKKTPGVYVFDNVEELSFIINNIANIEKCDFISNTKRFKMIDALERFLAND